MSRHRDGTPAGEVLVEAIPAQVLVAAGGSGAISVAVTAHPNANPEEIQSIANEAVDILQEQISNDAPVETDQLPGVISDGAGEVFVDGRACHCPDCGGELQYDSEYDVSIECRDCSTEFHSYSAKTTSNLYRINNALK